MKMIPSRKAIHLIKLWIEANISNRFDLRAINTEQTCDASYYFCADIINQKNNSPK